MDDLTQQPSSVPPVPAGGGEAPATPPPAAEVVLPPAFHSDPETPPATGSTGEAAADEGGLDYEALIEEHGLYGISAAELGRVYPDAHYVVHRFGGQAFQEQEGIGNDARLLRALGKLGNDMRVNEEAFNRAVAALPTGTKVTAPPLTGAHLTQAVQDLLDDYLDRDTRQALEHAGLLTSKEGRAFLEKVASAKHQLVSGLSAIGRVTPEVKARQEALRDREAVARVAPSVKAMSKGEFDAEIGRLYSQLAEEERSGFDLNVRDRLKTEIMQITRARYV